MKVAQPSRSPSMRRMIELYTLGRMSVYSFRITPSR